LVVKSLICAENLFYSGIVADVGIQLSIGWHLQNKLLTGIMACCKINTIFFVTFYVKSFKLSCIERNVLFATFDILLMRV